MASQTRYPILSTFSAPPKDSVTIDYIISSPSTDIVIALNSQETVKNYPAWIPNTALDIKLNFCLNYKEVKDVCELVVDDHLDLLVVISSSQTREKAIRKFQVDVESNVYEKFYKIELDPGMLSGSLNFETMLLVSPKPEVTRKFNSPSLKNTILWSENLELVLEQNAPLGSYKVSQLDGALWKIRINLPSDPSEWLLLDFNRVVEVEMDVTSDADPRLRIAAYSEIFFLAIDQCVTTPGALEAFNNSTKKGTFVTEMENKLLSVTGLSLIDLDKIRELWNAKRYEYLVEMQRLIFDALKNNGESDASL